MSRWGKCDFKELQALQKRMEQLQRADLETLLKTTTNQVAARLLSKVIKRTPVGVYPPSSGKVGGTLRRNWRSSSVRRVANGYEVTVYNNTHYAPYVEYGHRTRGGGGWVEGRFMLTKSELEIEKDIPRIIEVKLKKLLGETFGK